MIFKELTRHDGDAIFVNIALVLYFRRDGDETLIVFAGVDNVRVKETPEQIIAALPA